MVGVIFVMMLFVVPNFSEMFAGMGTDLPKITQMIINMSNYFTKRWYLIIGVVILIIVALQMFSKSETGKMIFGRLALTMPLFGKLTVKSSTASLPGPSVPYIDWCTHDGGIGHHIENHRQYNY